MVEWFDPCMLHQNGPLNSGVILLKKTFSLELLRKLKNAQIYILLFTYIYICIIPHINDFMQLFCIEFLTYNFKRDFSEFKGTLTRDFLHAVFGIKTRPATPLFIP
jgi:hypothetical protein